MAKTEFGKFIEEMYGDLEGFFEHFDTIQESLENIKNLESNIKDPLYDFASWRSGGVQIYKTKEDYNIQAQEEITCARADICVAIESISHDFEQFLEWNRK